MGIYISLTETHECGNWDCGRAIPFLGICVSNFRYCFFAVRSLLNFLIWEGNSMVLSRVEISSKVVYDEVYLIRTREELDKG